MSEDPAPGPVRSILIVRLSAIGDVVMATALLPALRRAYPEARIDWLVEPAAYEVIANNPHLDEVLVWPKDRWREWARKGPWFRLIGQMAGAVRRLRRARYDLVLDLQGLAKSAFWARITGARRRLGLASGEGSDRLMTQVVNRPADDPRMGSEYLRMAEVLGLDTGDFAPDLAIGPEPRVLGIQRLREVGIEGPYAVALPFTTRSQKHWAERYWPDLAQRIRERYGLPTVLLGGPGDRSAAQRLAEGGGEALRDLTGRTSLGESLGLIAGSRLAVGVDTGLTHAAVGLRIPTVALFGSTRPYLEPPGERATVLYDGLACAPCRRHPTCGGTFDCMAGLTPDRVMGALEELTPRPATPQGATDP